MTSRALHQLLGRRILFLNWRDRLHPRAGGAEVHCQTLAGIFTQAGAKVTLFTAAHANAGADEVEEGVTVVRRGGNWSVYLRAAAFLLRNRSSFDVVVDVQNGLPFFSPLFVGRRVPVVGVIHHVHQGQFALYLSRFGSAAARALEGPVSRFVYRRTPIIVVSPSTREAVRRTLRFSSPLYVVPNGQELPTTADSKRSQRPTIACVGRLVRHKRIEDLLEAVAKLLPDWSDLTVSICGSGPAELDLKLHAARLNLGEAVTFHGQVGQAERNAIVSESWLTVNPSFGEGWGLTVLESNALGVPTVAYDVPGLRDSILNHTTGWLVPDNPGALSKGIDEALRLLTDSDESAAFALRCKSWAGRFSWSRSADSFAGVLVDEMNRIAGGYAQRVGPSDLNVVAEFQSADPPATAELMSRQLRGTDDWVSSGQRFQVLLRGCDELDALTTLERIQPYSGIDLRLANRADLLVGVAVPGS